MTQQFTITRLGHQGDGIADGPVYAPRTLPGEVVSGTLVGQLLTDIRVEVPSDQRVKAPCRHYKACGGCQLQHAADDFVADWKVAVVRNALAAQGLDAPMRPIHTSPERSRRRATIAVRRTKKGTLAGFHGRASDTITEIPGLSSAGPGLDRGHSRGRSAGGSGWQPQGRAGGDADPVRRRAGCGRQRR